MIERKTTTKNAAKTPQINKRNRLPLSALRCHRDRLSTTFLAPFLAVAYVSRPCTLRRPFLGSGPRTCSGRSDNCERSRRDARAPRADRPNCPLVPAATPPSGPPSPSRRSHNHKRRTWLGPAPLPETRLFLCLM